MIKKSIFVNILLLCLFLAQFSFGFLDEKQILKITDKIKPSIVYIDVLAKIPSFKGEEKGTVFQKNGVIISSTGYILTSFISDKIVTYIKAIINNKEYPAKLIGNDTVTRIAVLKIKSKEILIPVNFSQKNPQPGEWLIGVYCSNEEQQYRKFFFHCLVGGIIPSGLSDKLFLGVVPSADGLFLVNTKSEISCMMLPFFNYSVDLLENDEAKLSKQLNLMNASVSPVSTVPIIEAANRIIKEQKSLKMSWIGIQLKKLTKQQAEGFNIPHKGVLITRVFKDSPAEKAGLKANDVIIEIKNKEIIEDESGMNLLIDLIRSHTPDTEMKIKIIRNAKIKEISITPIEFPEKRQSRSSLLGITVQEIDDMVYSGLNLFTDKGVIVIDVEPGTYAFNSDIKTSDLIVGIQNTEIKNIDDWQKKLNEIQENKVKNILLRIYRGNKTLFRVIKNEE